MSKNPDDINKGFGTVLLGTGLVHKGKVVPYSWLGYHLLANASSASFLAARPDPPQEKADYPLYRRFFSMSSSRLACSAGINTGGLARAVFHRLPQEHNHRFSCFNRRRPALAQKAPFLL